MTSKNPIGIFDSGVGGLSVLRQIHQLLPHENLVYVADQGHVPYGPRSASEIQRFSHAITEFLLQQQAKIIVVACNTATAAALNYLRQTFTDISFIGMEPAVKPAARQTQSGQVGVLATTTTIQSERYADLMARFAQDVTVYEDPCLGLVEAIEAGKFAAPETKHLLQTILQPMLANQVDTVVLGCTHYPFVVDVIVEIVGTAVSIIDPAPAVARQTQRVLAKEDLLNQANIPPRIRLITTGKRADFANFVDRTLALDAVVETAVWESRVIHIANSHLPE